MHTGKDLASVSERLVPGFTTLFDWGDVWDRPLTEGLAFQWSVMAALVSALHARGWRYSFPVLGLPAGKALFQLRNEIPYHHGAQPGHAAMAQRELNDLSQRFLQAFIPKVIVEKTGRDYSMFFEGCPYHRIMTNIAYDERPDIVFLPGRPSAGFPCLVEKGSQVGFSFVFPEGAIASGALRLQDSPSPLPVWRNPPEGMAIPIAGVAECTVEKPESVAGPQMRKYAKLFSSASGSPPALALVDGDDPPQVEWKTAAVRLNSGDLASLQADLFAAAKLVLTTFGIT